jgi:malate dehydrogenase
MIQQPQQQLTITVTGAAGAIAYALLPRLGELLIDVDTRIVLKLCDLPSQMQKLEAVAMELEDFAAAWIERIVCTSDYDEAFSGTQMAILVGAFPRTDGMERSDLLEKNASIFKDMGQAISRSAHPDVKVLVVGNPCNTNAFICMQHAANIPSHQFFSLSMLDQNRAYAFVADHYGLDIALLENLCVWGNHSTTMYVDYARATYDGKPLLECVEDHAWLANEFQTLVAHRGSAVIKARGASSAMSAANAIIDNLIFLLTPDHAYGAFSMGVRSNGEYGATAGTIVSYPCIYDNKGQLRIAEHIDLDPIAQKRVLHSFEEIASEAEMCRSLGLLHVGENQ